MEQKTPGKLKLKKIPRLTTIALFFILLATTSHTAFGATASITAPANGYSTTVGSTVTFVGGEGVVTGTATYSWVSSLDGSLGTTLILTTSSLSIGSHTITFVVTDDNGPSIATISITITNASPTTSITNPSNGNTFALGASVTFIGSASDTEDGVLTGTSISWTSSIDGVLGTGSPVSTTTLTAGTHTITLTATDSSGYTGSSSISITVSPNASPTAAISSPANGSSVAAGSYVTFQGTGTDTEDGALGASSLSWTSSLDGALGTGSPLSVNTLSVGSHTITLTVTDSKSATGTASISMTVTNASPTATISNPSAGASYALEASVSFIGAGSDTEDGVLASSSLSWASNIDGALGTGSPLNISTLSSGTHTITLTATDSNGATGTDTVSITVAVNASPTATISNPSTVLSFTFGTSVNFIGAGSDTEDGILSSTSLTWSSNINGILGTGSPLSVSTLSSGNHTITLTAADSKGATGTATVSITIAENVLPTAAISSPPTGSVFNDGDTIIFTGSATDTEDGTLSGTSLSWSSNKDGIFGTGGSLSTKTLSKGTHTITLTATDKNGGIDTETITITAGNTAPTATISQPKDGSSFAANTTITFNGLGTDDEAGILTYQWESSIDGVLSTSSYFTSSGLNKGDHTITFTVTDADGVSTSASVKITAGNAIPVAKINNPANGSTYNEGVKINFNGTATDTEDITLTGESLVWTSNLDGMIEIIGTGTSLSTDELEGGTHIITLTATDSDGATNDQTSPVTVTVYVTKMTVSPSGLSIKINETGTLTASGGTSPFRVSNRYSKIASVTIDKSTGAVTVKGLQEGETTISITDANKITASAKVAVMAQTDTDGDGVPDVNDAFPKDKSESLDTDSDGKGNNTDTDDDGDGMPDTWEILYHLDPLINDASQDLDGDGFSNIDEYKNNTDPSNSAPSKPVLYLPSDKGAALTLTPELETHDFSDPSVNDLHAKTRWQISTSETFSTIISDVTSSKELTKLKVLDHILTASPEESYTYYYWRVKFYDNYGGVSVWSEAFSFKAPRISATDDTDANGIPDDQEVSNTVDLNKDGTPDNIQSSVKTVNYVVDENKTRQIAAQLHKNATAIDSFRSITTIPDLVNAPDDLPFGLINFKIKVYKAGESAQVIIHLSEPVPDWSKWYKYDPENGWEDYSDYAEISDDGLAITLTLKDGDIGDADGTENGIIIDPSGISTTRPDDQGDDSDSGCFVSALALDF